MAWAQFKFTESKNKNNICPRYPRYNNAICYLVMWILMPLWSIMVQRWFPWGCLLLRGGIFHRATDNDEFYLSLGFTAYCALGVRLEIQAVDSQDRVYWKNCQPIKVASHPLPIGIRKLSFLILSRPGETLDIDGQEYLTFPNFGATTAGIDKLKFMFNFKGRWRSLRVETGCSQTTPACLHPGEFQLPWFHLSDWL